MCFNANVQIKRNLNFQVINCKFCVGYSQYTYNLAKPVHLQSGPVCLSICLRRAHLTVYSKLEILGIHLQRLRVYITQRLHACILHKEYIRVYYTKNTYVYMYYTKNTCVYIKVGLHKDYMKKPCFIFQIKALYCFNVFAPLE